MNIKQEIADYWQFTIALAAAEALDRKYRSKSSRMVADHWRERVEWANERIESFESEEIVIDGELPAPDVVPDNVVPFPNCGACTVGIGAHTMDSGCNRRK